MIGLEKVYTLEMNNEIKYKTTSEVSKTDPIIVKDYAELIELITRISRKNKGLFPLYRGQSEDHKTRNEIQTKLTPSIYRPEKIDGNLKKDILKQRFDDLFKLREGLFPLLNEYNAINKYDYEYYNPIIWAILQHYGIARTPLLDLTQSILIACSFALEKNKKGFVYMLGFDELTPTMAYSFRTRSLLMRLSSIMPEFAKRPLYQEGYFISNFPEGEPKNEDNFSNRLLAKFKIDNTNENFWGKDFKEISTNILYPEDDEMKKVLLQLLKNVSEDVKKRALEYAKKNNDNYYEKELNKLGTKKIANNNSA